ncbi:MAG: protein-export chaperone SecB [Alphaproteobacteria bacterium]
MAEENQTAQEEAQQAPSINVQVQYIKDLSFECPNSPEVFLMMAQNKLKPAINVVHDVQVGRLGEGNVYEVVLSIKVDCQNEEDKRNMFLLELAYAGVFVIEAQENIEQLMLFVEAPRLLFPFARQIVASTIIEAGFPPVHLPPIDFMESFRQKVAQAQAEQGNNEGEAPAND